MNAGEEVWVCGPFVVVLSAAAVWVLVANVFKMEIDNGLIEGYVE